MININVYTKNVVYYLAIKVINIIENILYMKSVIRLLLEYTQT